MNGYRRLMDRYKIGDMRNTYKDIYRGFCDERRVIWQESV